MIIPFNLTETCETTNGKLVEIQTIYADTLSSLASTPQEADKEQYDPQGIADIIGLADDGTAAEFIESALSSLLDWKLASHTELGNWYITDLGLLTLQETRQW